MVSNHHHQITDYYLIRPIWLPAAKLKLNLLGHNTNSNTFLLSKLPLTTFFLHSLSFFYVHLQTLKDCLTCVPSQASPILLSPMLPITSARSRNLAEFSTQFQSALWESPTAPPSSSPIRRLADNKISNNTCTYNTVPMGFLPPNKHFAL